MKLTQEKLDNILAQIQSRKNVKGVTFHIKTVDGSIHLQSSSGNLTPATSYYIASINKFLISFIVHRLCIEKRMNLQDKISYYLPDKFWKGIHFYNGKDYSEELTVQHLLTQTSGLPCYLIDKGPDGKRNFDLILNGENQSWPIERVIPHIRKVEPKYRPGSRGRANYSETNFRLLAKILEAVTKTNIKDLFSSIFAALGMEDTYVLSSSCKGIAPVLFKDKEINIGNYWSSTNYDVASTGSDQIKLLKAFFGEDYFSQEYLEAMKVWNNIFFPFKYGTGIEKFHVPRILSPFKKVPEIIGHAGSVGSVAFYIPEKQVYIAGTVNQSAAPNLAFKTIMKILQNF